MAKLRTHYDNLQVIENACPEVIKGAYRHLSQKWHPDKNPNNREEAERITKIINEAYEALSNPAQRQEHDEWIREQREQTEQQIQETSPISNSLKMSPIGDINPDDSVGDIRKAIESVFCLPEGSVALCDKTGHALRADAKIKTLRSRWGL